MKKIKAKNTVWHGFCLKVRHKDKETMHHYKDNYTFLKEYYSRKYDRDGDGNLDNRFWINSKGEWEEEGTGKIICDEDAVDYLVDNVVFKKLENIEGMLQDKEYEKKINKEPIRGNKRRGVIPNVKTLVKNIILRHYGATYNFSYKEEKKGIKINYWNESEQRVSFLDVLTIFAPSLFFALVNVFVCSIVFTYFSLALFIVGIIAVYIVNRDEMRKTKEMVLYLAVLFAMVASIQLIGFNIMDYRYNKKLKNGENISTLLEETHKNIPEKLYKFNQ